MGAGGSCGGSFNPDMLSNTLDIRGMVSSLNEGNISGYEEIRDNFLERNNYLPQDNPYQIFVRVCDRVAELVKNGDLETFSARDIIELSDPVIKRYIDSAFDWEPIGRRKEWGG